MIDKIEQIARSNEMLRDDDHNGVLLYSDGHWFNLPIDPRTSTHTVHFDIVKVPSGGAFALQRWGDGTGSAAQTLIKFAGAERSVMAWHWFQPQYSDRAVREKPDVMPTVVNLNAIAAKVNDRAADDPAMRAALLRLYPDARLFAVDADPRSLAVRDQGDFDGRANVLISVPNVTRSGRPADVSLTLPATVAGRLLPTGDVEVAGVRIDRT